MKHFVKLFIILIVLGFGVSVWADHVDPVATTNKNEQTTLFKDSVEDVGGFENQINSGKDTAINGLNGSSKVLEDITGKKESEVRQTTGNLEKIRANDLESAGAKEMQEKKVIEELYINEEENLWQEHKKDAELIANGTKDLLNNLLGLLKDRMGIDCKQVKGSKVIEPEYHIQIQQKQSKDAKYNQHFCEDRRNKYNCRDQLTVKCTKKGIRWNEWQNRDLLIPGGVVYWQAWGLGYEIFWKRKRWGWHIHQDSSGWRSFISAHLNIPLTQIHETIGFPNGARGIGNINPCGERWRQCWDNYSFTYRYRDGVEICEEWAETWTESCGLQ